jgi:hypothetical protein
MQRHAVKNTHIQIDLYRSPLTDRKNRDIQRCVRTHICNHIPNYVDMVTLKIFIRAILGSNYCPALCYTSRDFSRVSSVSEQAKQQQNLGSLRTVRKLQHGECAMLHISALHATICLILSRREACADCRVTKNASAHCVLCATDSSSIHLVMNHFDRNIISTFSVGMSTCMRNSAEDPLAHISAPARPRWIIVLMSDDVRRTKGG